LVGSLYQGTPFSLSAATLIAVYLPYFKSTVAIAAYRGGFCTAAL
jgi:hypothetical protein